jgi:Lysyl oxidase
MAGEASTDWVLARRDRRLAAAHPGGEVMNRPGRGLRRAAAAGFASAVAAAALAGPALAGTQVAAHGPVVKLIVAQKSITLTSFRGQVFLDPGVYVASLGSALQFDVQRASYTKPITLTQVIYRPGGGTTTRSLPSSLLDGFNGLRDFLRLSVADTAGQVVASTRPLFCPNFGPQRAVPGSARTNPYPPGCAFDPFPKSLVIGLARGWAADPAGFSFSFPPPTVRLAPGKYTVTAAIAPQYVRLLHITAADATASVKLTVVKGRGCCAAAAPKTAPGRARALAPLPRVPFLASPPAAALPDLVPLPSWGIGALHDRRSGRDLLTFGATVWVGGNSPLDVEGFRSNGSPVMKAYQYFWRNGHVVGRARAGTMGFDSKPGHNHWHFEQFARYQLLDSARNLAVRSHKVGFCIAPSDPVNLLAPHAVWQPPSIGFSDFTCGSPTALWVQEMMPVGWGDTYFQDVAGQAFDITSVPNGTYYIEVIANPQHVLYESNTHNDVSLRKVILGGTSGHRTVKVPPWHGIDPEG